MPRGRPKGSKSSLSEKCLKQLEYLQLVLGQPKVGIIETLVEAQFKAEDAKRSGKLSAALNAELEAKAKSDALKAELTPMPKATA